MPWAVVVSRDGRSVYTGGATAADGLLAFRRDTASGALAPAGCLRGYRGLCSHAGGGTLDADVIGLELAPDDRLLVVATHHGLGVIHRDPATGALSQAPGQCVVEGFEGTSYDEPSKDCRRDRGLGRPIAIDMTADGRTVYVASDKGLHAFALDPGSGALTATSKVKGGFGEVAVAPDGRSVSAVTEDFDLRPRPRDVHDGRRDGRPRHGRPQAAEGVPRRRLRAGPHDRHRALPRRPPRVHARDGGRLRPRRLGRAGAAAPVICPAHGADPRADRRLPP
jgi:hypothetical protein